MKLHHLLPGLLLWLGTAYAALAQQTSVTIAVAANLLVPMQQIEKMFEQQHPNMPLTLVSGSSGKLATQILNGAPYDIFMAADMQFAEKVYEQGHARHKPTVLVRGKLVLWSKQKMDTQAIARALQQQRIRTVAIAQPELAPYGRQAKNWLEEHQLYQKLGDKLIFAESINQVNQYIKSGAVDAAFAAVSAMHAPELEKTGYWYPLQLLQEKTDSLDHGMVLLTNTTADQKTLDTFVQFLHSAPVDEIFLSFGYELP